MVRPAPTVVRKTSESKVLLDLATLILLRAIARFVVRALDLFLARTPSSPARGSGEWRAVQ